MALPSIDEVLGKQSTNKLSSPGSSRIKSGLPSIDDVLGIQAQPEVQAQAVLPQQEEGFLSKLGRIMYSAGSGFAKTFAGNAGEKNRQAINEVAARFGKQGLTDTAPELKGTTGEKVAETIGELGGMLSPVGAAYKTIGVAATKGLTKAVPSASKLAQQAARGGASFGAYEGLAATGEGKSPTEIAKRIAVGVGLGAVGDVAVERLLLPFAKKGIEKVAPKIKTLVAKSVPQADVIATSESKLPKLGAKVPKERQFAQSVRESEIAPSAVKENLDVNKLTYEPITNRETFSKATELVNKNADDALALFNSPSKGVSADDVALGEALITRAIKDGNAVEANRLIADLAEKLTTAGQAVQAASIFKKLTPEGMLLYAQRIVNSANKDLLARMGIKAKKIELTPDDSQFILDTMKKVQQLPDGRQRDIELARVTQFIANKVPATLSDRLKGLQRVSLLLNPKTMVRNVMGNVIFGTIDNASNVLGTPIDIATSKLLRTGKRTTTLPSITGQLKSGFQGAKETIQDARLGVDTYAGRTQYELPSKRTFFSKPLNALDQATKVGLQLGDRPFYQAAYDDVLRQQMKLARTTEPTREMIDLAHEIAQQRTYQDVNSLTTAFKQAQSALNFGKNFGLGNIVLPFTKTPANILKRAIEYSPVGLEKAIREATNLSKGTFNQKAFVDSISRSVTGTALIMVGYDLAKRGMLTGAGNKDKDVAAFERNLGKNDYAYKVGDEYFTYDWAQPASMALAVGADIYLKGKDRKDAENVIMEAVQSGGETLFKQSLLQGVQRFFGGYSPIENIANTVSMAPTQLIPTFSKQIAQLTDPVQRSTYSPGGGSGTASNVVKSKIPGLNKTLEPKISTFGEPLQTYQGKNSPFNVFLNPGISTEFKPTAVQSEILRLYKATEDKNIFPKLAPRYFMSDKEKITLTPQEVTKFQQTMGKKTETRMARIVNTSISDSAKVSALKQAIDLSYEEAKKELLISRRKAGAINPR